MKAWKILLLALAAILFSNPVLAEDPGPLASSMEAFVVTTDKDGAETRAHAEKILPDQVIEYVLRYKNISGGPLKNFKLVGPIPANTAYISETATENFELAPKFSIDGGETYQPEPVKYEVELPDGNTEERVATPDMYTHLRWDLKTLDPGSSKNLSYRVRVK